MTFVADLLRWGQGRRADLPWRRRREPWPVLVSEFMLQQTQVDRIAPRFVEFVDRFPTPASLAGAERAEVIRHWHGLGYNRRAVHLHRAAERIVSEHDGEVPGDLDALLELPGVGPYTARAVGSLAFDLDVGVLDTNAARVLARAVAGRSLGRAEAQRLADDLVPHGRARGWNQAVMDLGAEVCTRRGPDCERCPVRASCVWAASGWARPDPVEGTAGASTPQARFEGSDRQGRGRLVAALRRGPVGVGDAPMVAGWPDDRERTDAVVAGLVADGLAELRDGRLELPS